MGVIDLETGKKTTSKGQPGRIIDLESGGYAPESDPRYEALNRIYDIEREQSDRAAEQRGIAKVNEGIGDFEQYLIGVGRGMTNIARGVGLAGPEPEAAKAPLEALNEGEIIGDVGEITGEAAPFVALAPLGGAGLQAGARTLIPAAKSLGAKILTGAALGATEGAVITRGRGGDSLDTLSGAGIGGAVGGGAEVLFGAIGRLGGALFRKLGKKPGPMLTPEGAPTKEFQSVLDETGTSFDDLVAEAQDAIRFAPDGTNPEQLARKARFDSQGIPATMGDITQDFGQQAREARLVTSSDVSADGLRDFRLEQSDAFVSQVDSLISELGVPDEVGDSVKAALTSQKALKTKEKNALYRKIADQAPELETIPVLTQGIEESLPDARTIRRLKRINGSQVDAAEDLMIEFGIIKDPEKVEAFISSGGELTPLSMGNFEDFRQGIGQIERADQTNAVQVFTGPIKSALDGEVDLIGEAMKSSGIEDDAVVDLVKKARGTVREIKTDFSPQSIAGRLIDTKKDGVTPIVEASKVAQTLMAKGAPVENLSRTVKLLRNSKGGAKAIGDLQATVVLQALENSTKATGRKVKGESVFSGAAFEKALRDVGEDKLNVLFDKNPSQLKKLMNLRQTGLDTQPANDAVPKGSASVLLDIARRAGRLPGIAAIVEVGEFVVKAGADDRAIARALKVKPEYRRTMTMMEAEFPALASALGISALLQGEQESATP